MPIIGARRRSSGRGASALLDHPRRVGRRDRRRGLSASVSSVQYVTHWQDDMSGKPYFTTLLRAIAVGRRPGPPRRRRRSRARSCGPLGYPENLLSHLLGRTPTTPVSVDVATDDAERRRRPGPRRTAPGVPRVRRSPPGTAPRAAATASPADDVDPTRRTRSPSAAGGSGSATSAPAASPVVRHRRRRSTYSTVHRAGRARALLRGRRRVRLASRSPAWPTDVTLCTDDVTVGRPDAADDLGGSAQ